MPWDQGNGPTKAGHEHNLNSFITQLQEVPEASCSSEAATEFNDGQKRTTSSEEMNEHYSGNEATAVENLQLHCSKGETI